MSLTNLTESYDGYRNLFQYNRRLCDIGKILKLVYPFLKKAEQEEVEEKYKNEDMVWLRSFLKRRGYK